MKDKKFWISLIAGIMAVLMLLTLILGILPAFADAAQSSSAIKQQIEDKKKENAQTKAELDDLKKKLEALNKEQNANKSEIRKILDQKDLIDQQLGLLYDQIANTNEQIAAYNVLIADKQEELEKAQKRLADLNEKYKERIRAMEEDGNISYWAVLFESNSFIDLLDRLNMIQEIAASDSKRLQALRDAATAVEEAQAELVEERAALELVKSELAAAQSDYMLKGVEAQELLVDLTAVMKEMEKQEDSYKDMVDIFEAEMEKFEQEIGKLQADFDKAVYEEYLATMTTAPTNANGDKKKGGTTVVDESGLKWVVPCNYLWVSSAWGYRTHPVTGQKQSFHNGVDLATGCYMRKNGTTDSPILATRAGVVIVSGWSDTAGWWVTIDHMDGYTSTYMHMCCRPFVSYGQVVAAGQTIGCIGTSGRSTGYHLHFGIYKNGSSVNPMKYIG